MQTLILICAYAGARYLAELVAMAGIPIEECQPIFLRMAKRLTVMEDGGPVADLRL